MVVLLVPETLSPFHVRSRVGIDLSMCGAKYEALFNVQSKSESDLHKEWSNADIAPHMKWSNADVAPQGDYGSNGNGPFFLVKM